MFIALSNSDPNPLYEQIEKQIIEQVVKGKLKAGDILPSIRLLAKELEISVITVKKAYENLEYKGFIVTKPGKGSFISEAGEEYVKESKLKKIQEYFEKGIDECRLLGMKDNEIVSTIKLILEEKD